MKELVSALSQSMANRLKSPILGTFALSWIAINHSELITFFYSPTDAKLTLLQQDATWFVWSFDSPILMKVIYPFAAALAYTFLIPVLQHVIDEKKHLLIDKKRIDKQHKRLADRYNSLASLSEAKAKSSDEYWQDKLKRDLDTWETDRENLETDLSALRSTNETTSKQLADLQKEKEALIEQLDALSNENSDMTVTSDKLHEELERHREAIKEEVEKRAELYAKQKQKENELDKLTAQYQDMKNEIDAYRKVSVAYTRLQNLTKSSEGILEFISNLEASERRSLDDHYLDNPNFIARSKLLRNPTFIQGILADEKTFNLIHTEVQKYPLPDWNHSHRPYDTDVQQLDLIQQLDDALSE